MLPVGRNGTCLRREETSLRNALGYLINDTLDDAWQDAIGIDGELSIDVASRTVLIAGRSAATGELSFCRVFQPPRFTGPLATSSTPTQEVSHADYRLGSSPLVNAPTS